MTPEQYASELLAAYDQATLLAPPTAGDPAFNLERAYEVADALRTLRIARGERPMGYKIGFTNRTIWPRYGVYGPIWGPVWNTTLRLLDAAVVEASLTGLVQPRLEPEIVFGLRKSPRAGLSEAELLDCIEWVAHGFEVVHTHFEGWRFQAADTAADFALHGRLYVGPRVPIRAFANAGMELAALSVQLLRDGTSVDEGRGSNVLDGPLNALRLWIDAMASQSQHWPISAGDVVTTGTLTDAAPMLPNQHWTTRLSDARLAGLSLRSVA